MVNGRQRLLSAANEQNRLFRVTGALQIEEISKPRQLCRAVKDDLIKLLRMGLAPSDMNGRGADEGLRPRVGQSGTAHLERRRALWTRL